MATYEMDDKNKPETVTPEEFRAALEYIRAGKDDAAALAAERERLKLEREQLAVETAREKLRQEQSRDRIATDPHKTIDPGGVVAAIMSAVGALVAIIGAFIMLG